MKNTTDQSTGIAPWAARPEPTSEPQRVREMPLLFQLADVNRVPPVPAHPAPVEMPSLGSYLAANPPFPVPTTTFSDPWPQTPTSLFAMDGSLSTSALAMGVHAPPRPDLTVRSKSAAAKDAVLETPVERVSNDKPLPMAKAIEEKAVANKPLESQVASDKVTSPPVSSLPTAIDTAVKAASETTPTERKAEVKAAAKPETIKVQAKVDGKVDHKPEAKAETTTVASTTTNSPEAKTASETAANATAETTPVHKPSPGSLRRQRAEARQQKVESKAGGDWLQSHGKIIAIGFVLALVGTIYLARRNQKPGHQLADPKAEAPVGLAIEVPEDHDHHHDHQPAEAANTAPRLVEAPSHPMDPTPSPAASAPVANPAVSSTADLHPPTIPRDAQPAAASGEPLFPWQQGDARVATRPDAPAASPAGPPAPAAAPPAATGVPAGGPALNGPQYPETNLRDAPLLPPAPPDEQGRNRAPSRTSPASFTSTPGGNRYERTGSGLY